MLLVSPVTILHWGSHLSTARIFSSQYLPYLPEIMPRTVTGPIRMRCSKYGLIRDWNDKIT